MSDLVHHLDSLGVPLSKTGSGHTKVVTPNGAVFLPSSPSDSRSVRNCVTKLRRAGLDL